MSKSVVIVFKQCSRAIDRQLSFSLSLSTKLDVLAIVPKDIKRHTVQFSLHPWQSGKLPCLLPLSCYFFITQKLANKKSKVLLFLLFCFYDIRLNKKKATRSFDGGSFVSMETHVWCFGTWNAFSFHPYLRHRNLSHDFSPHGAALLCCLAFDTINHDIKSRAEQKRNSFLHWKRERASERASGASGATNKHAWTSENNSSG